MSKRCPLLTIVTFGFLWATVITSGAQSVGTALITNAPQIQGTVDGNLQQMTGATVTLNGSGTITGDLLAPGTPTLIKNGSPTFGGTIVGTGSTSPSNYQVILNGNSVRLGHLRTRTNPVTLPTVPAVPSPTGTRTVTITSPGQSVGSFSTLKNLTLNGNVGQYTIPAGTYGDFTAIAGSGFTLGVSGATQTSVYNFQHLTLNGATNIVVLSPVVINVANGFTANGTAGTSTNPAWLKINIVAGGFTLNGGCTLYSYVTVPSGTLTINGTAKLTGGAISKDLTVNLNGLLKLFDIASFENHPPVAANQSVTTTEDTAKQIVLSASDADGQTLTYSVVSQPAHGALSGTPPQLTYTPTHGYYGADSFTFKANDGQVDSNVATVSITITHVNHAPTANAQTISLNQDTSQSVTLTGSDPDNDTLTFRVTTSPAHGTLSGTPPNLTYTPAANFYGTDSFAFVANDGTVDSAPATVSITVMHVNHPPVANGQNVQTNEDTALSILLSATDVDSDPLTYSVLSSPAHGTLSGTAPNLTYTPAAHFHGTDSFTFKAKDGSANSNTATVQITVVHVNHPPIANGQNVSLDEDTTATVTLTGNDPDGDTITFSISAQPQHGTLSGTPPNVVYTPAPDYFGDDSFAFHTNDGTTNSSDGIVNLTVRSVNDPPTVQISSPANGAQFDAGDTVRIIASATDKDGTIATLRILSDGVQIFEGHQATAAYDLIDVPAGNHTLTAVAIDNEDASTTSAAVAISVQSQGNGPVQVNAGPDRLISLPSSAHLLGSVTVNGAPAGNNVDLAWQKISGPGNATFDNSASLTPTVTFDTPGDYVLKLVATAPEGRGFDTAKVTVLAAPQAGPGSPVSNQGREFWMAFLSQPPPGSEPDHAGAFLFISSEIAASGTVEIFTVQQSGSTWQTFKQVQSFTVAAGSKTMITVEGFFPLRYDNQYDQALPTSIHVVANAPVAVHALSSNDASTDGSLILPTGMLGRDYFVMSYNNSLSFQSGPKHVIGGTQLAVVGTKPQTQVTITPTASSQAHPAGQSFTVTLQPGDVYRLINKDSETADYTGTSVQSDKPVAVFGGHSCATVPGATSACDHLYEQMTPVDFWGRHFVTLPLATRHNGDRFRILAANDNTRASVNGQIVATLNAGQFYETVLDQPTSIVADQRVLVAQFAQSGAVDNNIGDPFMTLVPPYEEFGHHYILNTQAIHSFYHGGFIDPYDSYLGIIVDSAHTSAVSINGQPIAASQFVPIGDTGFSGANISVPKDSTFDISAPTPIGTWLYGWAPSESYGYTGGLYAELDAGTAQFTLTQSASSAPVGDMHRVRAQFTNAASLPVPGAQINFVVTGANPTNGSAVTAPDGSAEFSWTGAQAGTDTVTATSGAFSANIAVTWLANANNRPPIVNAGPDVIAKAGDPITLNGLVQDDGLPAGGQLTAQWSVLPGNGDFVTFANPNSAQTTATFAAPGQYHLRLTGFDGQFSSDDDLLVTVDAPPKFELFAPSTTTVDAGNQWSVDVIGSDADGLVAKVELFDGNQVVASVQPDQARTSRITLSTVIATVGAHTMTVRLTDDLGITTDQSVVVNARPAPVVQILTPASAVTIAAGDSVTFTASASSQAGAITQLIYQDVTGSPYQIGEGTGSNYTFTWTPTYAGTFQIAATAYDSAGAAGTSAPVSVTVQAPGDPTVTITSPQNGSSIYLGQSATFHANASAVSPATVSEVDFFDNGRFLTAKFSPPYELEWFPGNDGAHTLEADVYDSFGGYAATSITVNVTEPPDLTVTLVQPPPNIPVKVNSPTTLAASVDGVIGSLDGVQFYVNGQQVGNRVSSSVTWSPTAIGTYQIEVDASASNPNQFGYFVTNVTVADLHSPVVQWTAPANSSSFAPGAPIGLQAQASDVDGNLSKLQFFADGQLLSETGIAGNAGVANFSWGNAGPGWHTLTALAADDTLQSGNAFIRVFVERTVSNQLLPPSALTSEAISASGIHLTWTVSTSTNSVGTVIERRAGMDGVWQEIATIDSTAIAYDDSSLVSESYYSYRLASLDDIGERSIYSDDSSATTEVQLPQYAVIDLGESLDQSFVALNLIEQRFLYAAAGGPMGSAAVVDLTDADVMSISESNDVLLHKRATTSDGSTTVEYYLLWHPDGRKPDYIADPTFRAFRLSRDGVVAGAVNHSTVNQSGVADWIYQGLEFWSEIASRPGTVRSDGTRIDIRAATWTPATAVVELTPTDERQYSYDRLDINPARTFPQHFDSLHSAWDVSTNGTVVGTGSWSDLRGINPNDSLNSIPSYEAFTLQHGMRWKSGGWDTFGSLRRQSSSEGESIATAINPLGTIVVGNSAAPDRAGDPPSPTHAMRSVMTFRASEANPGDPLLQDLTPLGDGSYAWVWDVDANGGAVGYSTKHQADPISRKQAVWWGPSSTVAIELPNLGHNAQWPEGFGYANAINAAGDRVVGKSITSDGFDAGIIWALNSNFGGNGRLWESHDLSKQIPSDWFLVEARDINKLGFIVGIAYHTVPDPANPSGPPLQQRRSVLLLPIEILDKDLNVTADVKVGKMTETGVISGTETSSTLDIEKDSNRFYIRVPGGTTLGVTSIMLATSGNPDSHYDDDPTQLDLMPNGSDVLSKSLLLVSDDIDNDFQIDGIANNSANDRSLEIQLSGMLSIKSITFNGSELQVDAKLPVAVQKTVNVDVVILRDQPQAQGGSPVISQSEVETDLKTAQERYVQVGITLTWSISVADPPPGVDLSDGLTEFTSSTTPTPEEQALLSSLATPSTDDIQIFYVNFFAPQPGSKGEAFLKSVLAPSFASLGENAIISAADRGPFTLPHELGHILLNDGTHRPESINLMRNGTSLINTLGASKRLAPDQETAMQGSNHAQ